MKVTVRSYTGHECSRCHASWDMPDPFGFIARLWIILHLAVRHGVLRSEGLQCVHCGATRKTFTERGARRWGRRHLRIFHPDLEAARKETA